MNDLELKTLRQKAGELFNQFNSNSMCKAYCILMKNLYI